MNIDLDEIQPDRFQINNAKVQLLLRGEGTIDGRFFTLGTWRRDGLIARLRMRGFNIRTIDDRIAALPRIAQPAPLGDEGVRALSNARERLATFDARELRWRDLPVESIDGRDAVRVRIGAALRRRRGRGTADFFIATPSRDRDVNLTPVPETQALLHAYAQIAATNRIAITAQRDADRWLIAEQQATIPQPHREALQVIALGKAPTWTIPHNLFPLAQEIFGSLGITLQTHRQPR